MLIERREKLSSRMPPTPVTPEMREAMEGVAKEHGCTLSDVQRTAFSLFLRSIDTGNIEVSTNSTEVQEQPS